MFDVECSMFNVRIAALYVGGDTGYLSPKSLNWLRTSRKAQGLSMRELGIRMRMPHSWIGMVETG
jgi:hypothetical protein